jgi:hypothetical protein
MFFMNPPIAWFGASLHSLPPAGDQGNSQISLAFSLHRCADNVQEARVRLTFIARSRSVVGLDALKANFARRESDWNTLASQVFDCGEAVRFDILSYGNPDPMAEF